METVETLAASGAAAHDLSVWGLFLQADLVVKAVMLILLIASIWCWAIIIDKSGRLRRVNRAADSFEEAFWSGDPLDRLYDGVKEGPADPMSAVFVAGMREWRLGARDGAPKAQGQKAALQHRVERVMQVAITRQMEVLERQMTVLATVGSAAPFLGLFGTVWGIMNAFTSIAATQNTNLAVVAPGIAEALFATAIGLFAAIPATVAYNAFVSDLGRFGGRLDGFAEDFATILARYMDQDGSG